ncbi:MAG: hypothetical protein AAF824_15905 [Bacteroidota bacterium]
MKQPTISILLSLLLGSLLGCGDPISKEKNLDILHAHHLAVVEFFTIQQMFSPLFLSSTEEDLINPLAYCSQVFQYTSADSLFMEIDFGSGCTCQDGRIRQGKLIARRALADSSGLQTLLISPEQYGFIGLGGDLFQLDFITSVSQTTPGPHSSPPKIAIYIEKAVFNNLLGTFFCKGNFLAETFTHGSDPELQQISHQLSGTVKLKDENGGESNSYTLSPITYLTGCSHPVAGVVRVHADHEQEKTIDFGAGTCDKKAQVHIGLFTATVDLP